MGKAVGLGDLSRLELEDQKRRPSSPLTHVPKLQVESYDEKRLAISNINPASINKAPAGSVEIRGASVAADADRAEAPTSASVAF